MELIILCSFLAACMAAPMSQSMSVKKDGTYQFFYETGKEGGRHSRTESRGPDGIVVGKYSYEDPSGELREVHYRAGDFGYIAKGDVGVEGAPKSQFPVEMPEKPVENDVGEPEGTSQNQENPDADENKTGDQDNADENLPLEENIDDGPPEAFPQGFFLEKFTGLRRLPEPTKEDDPTTTEAEPQEHHESDDGNADEIEQDQKDESEPEKPPNPSSVEFFHHLRPFPKFAAQEWATSMFHQPVYVYHFQQPDAYGYHYFY